LQWRELVYKKIILKTLDIQPSAYGAVKRLHMFLVQCFNIPLLLSVL
jgi:hypothetical protein